MSTKADFWERYGYVVGSKNRKIVLRTLDRPYTPLELAKKTGLGMNLTSRALRELDKQAIVVCRNPDAKMGRVYELSELGKKIVKESEI